MKTTFASGLAAAKASPISVNASVNDDAANTVTSPETAVVVIEALSASDPQDAARKPNRATEETSNRGVLRMPPQ